MRFLSYKNFLGKQTRYFYSDGEFEPSSIVSFLLSMTAVKARGVLTDPIPNLWIMYTLRLLGLYRVFFLTGPPLKVLSTKKLL